MEVRETLIDIHSGKMFFIGLNETQYYDVFSFRPKEKEINNQTLSSLVIEGSTLLTKEKVKNYICKLIDDAEMNLKEED